MMLDNAYREFFPDPTIYLTPTDIINVLPDPMRVQFFKEQCKAKTVNEAGYEKLCSMILLDNYLSMSHSKAYVLHHWIHSWVTKWDEMIADQVYRIYTLNFKAHTINGAFRITDLFPKDTHVVANY